MPTPRLLMADDDLEDQAIIKDTLASFHAEDMICFAEDGARAIEVLEELYTKGTLPCLIILDLNMPKLNGMQTLQALKSDDRFKEVPVIIYSTSINSMEKEKSLSLGAHSYVTKPLSVKESTETVKLFLSFCKEETTN